MSLEWLTLDTWITSDHHWSHNNIREYQGRPENHFELMQIKWNSKVGHNDTVFHLGDLVCFGDINRHPFWLDGLHGKDKYLLKGNHDKHTDNWYAAAGFTVVGNKPMLWVGPDNLIVCFSHEPDSQHRIEPYLGGWDINIHGHIHANPYYEGTPMDDYRNVCVEVTDYAPVRLRDVLDGIAGRARLLSPNTP